MGSWSGGAAREGRSVPTQVNSENQTSLNMADDAKLQEIQKLGGTAIKPVGWDRTGWEAFQYMLYNPDTGEILTRTPLSWLKITVFYCIYYSCLAGFWIACLNVFFATLPEVHDGPRWLQADSIIGVNPGVGLRPRNTDARIDSQMFVLRQGDTNAHESEPEGEGDLNADYVSRTKKFLETYEKTDMGSRTVMVDGTEISQKYPAFSISELGECGEGDFGYVVEEGAKVEPCIFIKLNTICGWKPEPYECDKDDSDTDICTHINGQADKDDNIYINCAGRYAADQ